MFLLLFVILFAFLLLIPKGKAYRLERVALYKESKELRNYQNFHDETYEKLKTMQSENRHIITAMDTIFDADRFEKQHKEFFKTLHISEIHRVEDEENFLTYEVNTTSKISSPTSFYDFLDSINKSDWLIGVNFPINFQRDSELIKSSFTMKVYSSSKESNLSTSDSLAK